MNKIRQHVPGWIEGVEPKTAEFDTLDALLAIQWVAFWKGRHDFYRFSLDKNRLMAECQKGRIWHVVGYLEESVDGLPKWK